jgi:hypothetical protein
MKFTKCFKRERQILGFRVAARATRVERDWRGRGDERAGDSAEGRGSGPVHERGASAKRVTIITRTTRGVYI